MPFPFLPRPFLFCGELAAATIQPHLPHSPYLYSPNPKDLTDLKDPSPSRGLFPVLRRPFPTILFSQKQKNHKTLGKFNKKH